MQTDQVDETNDAVITVVVPNTNIEQKESPQRPLVEYRFKNAVLRKTWTKAGDGTNTVIGGELATLLKSDLSGRGGVWIDEIIMKFFAMKNSGSFALGLSSSERQPTNFVEALKRDNFVCFMPTASTVGVFQTAVLKLPEGTSRQLYPTSAMHLPVYLTGVCSTNAVFVCNVVFRYHFTSLEEDSDF